MLKFTAVVIGLLATATIVQPAVAMNAVNTSPTLVIEQPSENLHTQLIINLGGDRSRRDSERRRYQERQRQEQIEREWREARYSRYGNRNDYRRNHNDYRR